MKRRQFVHTAAVGMAAPVIVPRHVLGGVGYTAPSDTVVIGMVGAGGMAASNASALVQRDDVRIGALADIDMKQVLQAITGRVESDNPNPRRRLRAGHALRGLP